MASVFFSYSHKDEQLRDQLEAHLALLRNQGLVDVWHDRRIVAGDEFEDSIFSKLESADIVLLLVSSDFINSGYCYSREMKRAMERHEAGQARVIPIILRHCDWHSAPFGKLTAAPRDGKPVIAWTDHDEAFSDVAKEVRRAVEQVNGVQATGPLIMAAAERVLPPPLATTAARSSNLRLKKEFSELDFDDFLRQSFDFIYRFFENSAAALCERNADIRCSIERIDSRRVSAALYRGGNKIAQCSIRLEALGRNGGIAFSFDESAAAGSYHEMLWVAASEQSLYFTTLAMPWNSSSRDAQLSEEGGAEFLWGLFIHNAQR